jgi:site-specific DNA-methyltransferase (adenine-specific)
MLIHHADMLDVCAQYRDAFHLTYIDPPYNTGKKFSTRDGAIAYTDQWCGRDKFIDSLRARVTALVPAMHPKGSLWIHLDYRTVHYVKCMCDDLLTFQGEIIWEPGNGARGKGISVTHQTMLVYTRGDRLMWNENEPQVREPFADTSLNMHFKNVDENGRHYRDRVVNSKTYRYYSDLGRKRGSVWVDIPSMVANSPIQSESTGYPTQKPEKLLERIILACTQPGDTVADLMCGSGTTLAVAQRLGRAYVGGDVSDEAILITEKRLHPVDTCATCGVVYPPGDACPLHH